MLVIGCSGGVDILNRLLKKCHRANPAYTLININAHEDCIEDEHLHIPLKATLAMEAIVECMGAMKNNKTKGT